MPRGPRLVSLLLGVIVALVACAATVAHAEPATHDLCLAASARVDAPLASSADGDTPRMPPIEVVGPGLPPSGRAPEPAAVRTPDPATTIGAPRAPPLT